MRTHEHVPAARTSDGDRGRATADGQAQRPTLLGGAAACIGLGLLQRKLVRRKAAGDTAAGAKDAPERRSRFHEGERATDVQNSLRTLRQIAQRRFPEDTRIPDPAEPPASPAQGEAEMQQLLTRLGLPKDGWERRVSEAYVGVHYPEHIDHNRYSSPQLLLSTLYGEAFPADHQALAAFSRLSFDAAVGILRGLRAGGQLTPPAPTTPTGAARRRPRAVTVPAMNDADWRLICEQAQIDAVEGTANHMANVGDQPSAAWRRIYDRWRVAGPRTWRLAVQERPTEVQLTSVVCNELDEVAQAHRGVRLEGGFNRNFAHYYALARQQREQPSGAFLVHGPSASNIPPGASLFFIWPGWQSVKPGDDDHLVKIRRNTVPLPADCNGDNLLYHGDTDPDDHKHVAGVQRRLPSGTRQWLKWMHEATVVRHIPELNQWLTLEAQDPGSRLMLRSRADVHGERTYIGFIPEQRAAPASSTPKLEAVPGLASTPAQQHADQPTHPPSDDQAHES